MRPRSYGPSGRSMARLPGNDEEEGRRWTRPAPRIRSQRSETLRLESSFGALLHLAILIATSPVRHSGSRPVLGPDLVERQVDQTRAEMSRARGVGSLLNPDVDPDRRVGVDAVRRCWLGSQVAISRRSPFGNSGPAGRTPTVDVDLGIRRPPAFPARVERREIAGRSRASSGATSGGTAPIPCDAAGSTSRSRERRRTSRAASPLPLATFMNRSASVSISDRFESVKVRRTVPGDRYSYMTELGSWLSPRPRVCPSSWIASVMKSNWSEADLGRVGRSGVIPACHEVDVVLGRGVAEHAVGDAALGRGGGEVDGDVGGRAGGGPAQVHAERRQRLIQIGHGVAELGDLVGVEASAGVVLRGHGQDGRGDPVEGRDVGIRGGVRRSTDRHPSRRTRSAR